MTIAPFVMSVFVILAVVWAWALIPPWLGNRRHDRHDPVAAFARFQRRDLQVPAVRRPRLDPQQRRRQVFALLLTADGAAAAAFVLLQQRWALALTAVAVNLTVAWYAAAVRLRFRTRRPVAPLAEVVALPEWMVVLLPAA